MKKLFILILLVAIGAGGYLWQKKGADDLEIVPTVSRPDASDATFQFDEGPVTLEDGSATEPIAPGSALSTNTTISEHIEYGDVNDDSKNDTVLLLLRESGGSGLFVYVAAYVSGNVDYEGSNAVFVGDRISPESLSIDESGTITLKYLDRRPDEAMAEAPTVPITKTYVYQNGELEEK